MIAYDAGYLNDWGGGNTDWWRDYIRDELARAHTFYEEQAVDETEELQQRLVELEKELDGLGDCYKEKILTLIRENTKLRGALTEITKLSRYEDDYEPVNIEIGMLAEAALKDRKEGV
uniref:Uncharacterized protein n=1 Tax=viral metagenome TaxID=1070528 RepID=A0A6M3LN60_9ZZZZ